MEIKLFFSLCSYLYSSLYLYSWYIILFVWRPTCTRIHATRHDSHSPRCNFSYLHARSTNLYMRAQIWIHKQDILHTQLDSLDILCIHILDMFELQTHIITTCLQEYATGCRAPATATIPAWPQEPVACWAHPEDHHMPHFMPWSEWSHNKIVKTDI